MLASVPIAVAIASGAHAESWSAFTTMAFVALGGTGLVVAFAFSHPPSEHPQSNSGGSAGAVPTDVATDEREAKSPQWKSDIEDLQEQFIALRREVDEIAARHVPARPYAVEEWPVDVESRAQYYSCSRFLSSPSKLPYQVDRDASSLRIHQPATSGLYGYSAYLQPVSLGTESLPFEVLHGSRHAHSEFARQALLVVLLDLEPDDAEFLLRTWLTQR